MSTIRDAAVQWIRAHLTCSTTGRMMVSQDSYDTITDADLRDAVDEFLVGFRVPPGSENSYSLVNPDDEE